MISLLCLSNVSLKILKEFLILSLNEVLSLLNSLCKEFILCAIFNTEEINVPFVIKNNFSGIIERGTPMFQVIPFKREKWDSKFDVKKPNEHFFDNEKFYSKISRAYHSLIKDKKIYR